MSTVIDGADQAQYGLPYFAQDDKSTTNGLKYKVGFEHNMKEITNAVNPYIVFVCVCVCKIDKTVCCSCAWGVCQRVLVLREHAKWDKCRCGGYAQVVHILDRPRYTGNMALTVTPPPPFPCPISQDPVGVH